MGDLTRTSIVVEPGVSVLHLIEGGSVVEYLETGNVKPATGNEVRLAEQCARLRETLAEIASHDAVGSYPTAYLRVRTIASEALATGERS